MKHSRLVAVAGQVALGTALLSLIVAAAPSPLGGLGAMEVAYAQNRFLHAYTFQINGMMVMHRFPWLHVRLTGKGEYERGVRYEVVFTPITPFGGQPQRVDLSTLAPSMWRHYRVRFLQFEGQDALYALKDPADPTLRVAIVRLNPATGIRHVDLQYKNGGDIQIDLACSRSTGYLLPISANATINLPKEAASIAADFTNYDIR